jgi:hypothetical protein
VGTVGYKSVPDVLQERAATSAASPPQENAFGRGELVQLDGSANLHGRAPPARGSPC